MKDKIKGLYIKRTQRDYPISFKMSVVREVESGELSIRGALSRGISWVKRAIESAPKIIFVGFLNVKLFIVQK